MIALQLYIEGQEVELFKDESITLSQSIQDVKDISKIFLEFSQLSLITVNNAVMQQSRFSCEDRAPHSAASSIEKWRTTTIKCIDIPDISPLCHKRLTNL